MLQRSRPFVMAYCGRDRHNCPVRWSEICVSRALSTAVLTPAASPLPLLLSLMFLPFPHTLSPLLDHVSFVPYLHPCIYWKVTERTYHQGRLEVTDVLSFVYLLHPFPSCLSCWCIHRCSGGSGVSGRRCNSSSACNK